MSKSIAVFGAGPGLGQAVARRYAREGYAVTLVGRLPEPLDLVAKELASAGTTAHVITADLSDTGATPRLAEQIRAKAGPLDAFYYAPTPETGFVSAANLTPQYAQNFMPLIFYTMLALVQEFLPHMLEQGDGAILTAQGGSTVQGLPNMSGPSPAQAAQRNYLQEDADKASTSTQIRTSSARPDICRALDYARHEGTAGNHLPVVSRADGLADRSLTQRHRPPRPTPRGWPRPARQPTAGFWPRRFTPPMTPSAAHWPGSRSGGAMTPLNGSPSG